MKEALDQMNYKSITYLIINSYEQDSIGRGSEFRTTVPVLQDIYRMRVWELYNGTTDDMLVFDR